MAARYVVATLAIACFIIFHVECMPRLERDDDSSVEYGSGYWTDERDDGADDLGASDAGDDTNDSETGRPKIPEDRGNSADLENKVTMKVPTALPIDYSYEDSFEGSDNSVGASDEDIGGAGSGFVSSPNKDVGTGNQDQPVFSAKGDKELALDLEEEAGPRESNERDNFFGKPEAVRPEAVKPATANNAVGLVGIGAKRTDVMLVFDNDYDYGDYDDSLMTEDPDIVSLERGDYKKDDFFDTIGMKKLDDFIPTATETKKAQDFIEGHNTSSIDMKEIFGEKSGSGGKTMKDDFFDSIGVKNIVTGKVDLKMTSDKKSNQVGGSVSQIGTTGLGGEMSFEEELKMQQLILKALRLFIGSPCYNNGRRAMTEKCSVFEDVLNAMALSGLTFNSGDRDGKPISSKSAKKWQW